MAKRQGSAIITVNAPVILGITAASGLLLAVDSATGGVSNRLLMSHFTGWLDPLMYLRFFTHVFAHENFAHFFGNYMLILVVGPLMEERYGGKRLLSMLAATAFITGLANAVFFRNVAVIGASGLAFMLILLSSFANIKKGGVPLTLLLVAFIYIGNEVLRGVFQSDNISQLSHIIGGLCGAGFGFYFKDGAK